MAGTDFSHLTNDELIKGIKALDLPDYIRSKAYGIDVRETLAQMTEMTIQLGVNMGLSPDDALNWARKLQESVSQSDFDSWVATLLDGGPSIFMNTLSELQTTYPNGAPGVALVRETDPAKIYVWNGSAWEDFGDYQGIEVKDGTITTDKIADREITTNKTDFINKRIYNLLDDNKLKPNTIMSEFGNEITYSGYSLSDWIEVEPNSEYTLAYRSNHYWFDGDKNIVSSATGLDAPINLISPPNAMLIRVTQDDSRPYQMLVKGNVELSQYVEYAPIFDLDGKLDVNSIDGAEDGELPLDKIKGIEGYTYNLFTEENMTPNTTLTVGSGVESETIGYDLSDYIPVKPNTTYRRAHALNFFWFDKDFKFISGQIGAGLSTKITSPFNARYIRQNSKADGVKQTLIEDSMPDLGYIAHTDINNSWYEFDRKINTQLTEKSNNQFSIIGDSFSTFEGWIPETNASWYFNNMTDGNDVNDVTKTWWYMLSKETGLKLLTNDSWSGSTVATASEMGTVDESHRAYVTRFHKYAGSGNVLGPKPDIIFVFGGTNDNTKNTEVGTAKYSDWTTEDDKQFAPAFAHLMNDLIKYNPTARVINITNGKLKSEIKVAQAEICNHYGVENVVVSGYASVTGHPDSYGMVTIKNAIKGVL